MVAGPVLAPRLWTRNFVALSVTNFFLATVFFMLMTSMAVHAGKAYQASEVLAGLAAALFILASTVARPLVGPMLERWSKKRLMTGALILFLVASLAYFAVGNLWALLVVRAIHGFSFGVANTVIGALVMSTVPPRRRGEGAGWFGAFLTVATAVGPWLAIVLDERYGYQAVFGAGVISALAALGLSTLVRAPAEPKPAAVHHGSGVGRMLRRFFEPHVFPLAFTAGLAAIGFSGAMTFISSYAGELGVPRAAGTFFLVYASALLVCRPLMGMLQDRRGDNAALIPATIASALALAVLAIAWDLPMVVVAALLLGFGYGTIIGSGQAAAAARSPRHRIGVGVATFYLLLDLGTGVGPVFLGALVPALGYRGMFVVAALCGGLAVALYLSTHARMVRREATAGDETATERQTVAESGTDAEGGMASASETVS